MPPKKQPEEEIIKPETSGSSTSSSEVKSKEIGDNSSSGVSSDHEKSTKTDSSDRINNNSNEPLIEDEDDLSPSPPFQGFQRHNSLTRKQAAVIAANRAKAQRHAVCSLAQLPPPIEADSDEVDNEPIIGNCEIKMKDLKNQFSKKIFQNLFSVAPPPPEFSDNVTLHHRHHHQMHHHNPNHMFVHHQLQQQQGVRIVGAVPKMITRHYQHHRHH